jgi:hypothetical protein
LIRPSQAVDFLKASAKKSYAAYWAHIIRSVPFVDRNIGASPVCLFEPFFLVQCDVDLAWNRTANSTKSRPKDPFIFFRNWYCDERNMEAFKLFTSLSRIGTEKAGSKVPAMGANDFLAQARRRFPMLWPVGYSGTPFVVARKKQAAVNLISAGGKRKMVPIWGDM